MVQTAGSQHGREMGEGPEGAQYDKEMGSSTRDVGAGADGGRNCPPPKDLRRALGIGLLQGPRSRQFLMSEVPV